MKKIILLLSIFTLVFASCSSDDDASSNQDPIIGTWTYHKLFIDDVEESLSACEMQETFMFNENGIYSYMYYEVFEGVCELEESNSGTWIKDENNLYTLTFNGESSSEEITFENNTFYFEYTELNGSSDPVLTTYKEVYISN